MGKSPFQLELVPPSPVVTSFYTVGLDLSLTGTGIVVISPQGEIVHQGLAGYELERGGSSDERAVVERYMYIASKVIDMVRYAVDLRLSLASADPVLPRVAIEGYAFSKNPKTTNSQTKLAELRGVVKSQLWLVHRIVAEILTAGEVRRSVLGKGNFPKRDIVDALFLRGIAISDHNVADAYVVAEGLRRRVAVLEGE